MIVSKTGSAKKMNGSIEEWNIVIVEKFDYPMPVPKEFQVRSKSVLGALMKANNIIKDKHDGWQIRCVWRLDPDRLRRR